MTSSNNFKLSVVLENPPQFIAITLASLIFSSVILGKTAAIANVPPTQVTLSVDATFAPTFEDLVNQAESRAEIEIYQRFQADPTIRELQITVLGERNGQLVSLFTSRISRNEWLAGSSIRQGTQYFSVSSALLGYRNSDPMSTRRSVVVSQAPSPEQSPSQTVEQARSSGRISEDEYWQLIDALD